MACIVTPGAPPGGFQKLFFGQDEVAIPQYGSTAEAAAAHPLADVFINFASFRRCAPLRVVLWEEGGGASGCGHPLAVPPAHPTHLPTPPAQPPTPRNPPHTPTSAAPLNPRLMPCGSPRCACVL